MARRVKATGCGKFFIILLIVVPIAFIGASLFNGKNPLDAFKELLGMEKVVEEKWEEQNENQTSESEEKDSKKSSSEMKDEKGASIATINQLKEDNAAKDRKIERIEKQLQVLEESLDKCQKQLQQINK
jgi:hypothetical protein